MGFKWGFNRDLMVFMEMLLKWMIFGGTPMLGNHLSWECQAGKFMGDLLNVILGSQVGMGNGEKR